MKRVFLYVRVSTEEQAIHGLSIEAQTAALPDALAGAVRLVLSHGEHDVDFQTARGCGGVVILVDILLRVWAAVWSAYECVSGEVRGVAQRDCL